MFWQRFKQLMEEQNTSFYKISKKTGISEATFTQYKNNKFKTPQKETLNKLSEYFNVSVDFLLGKTDDRPVKNINIEETVEEKKEEYKQEKQAEIYNIYENLNDTNKKILTDIGKIISIYQKKNDNE